MDNRIVSTVKISLLLLGMFTMTLNLQSVKCENVRESTSTEHDVAITGVVPDKTTVVFPDYLYVEVNVANKGTEDENVTLTVFLDSPNHPYCWFVITLPPGYNSLTVSIYPSIYDLGTWNLVAEISVVPGETNTADNVYIYGPITVTFEQPPTHDVAVTGVVASKSQVTVGELLPVSVTVQNLGTQAETFSVTAYFGSGKIGFDTETVTLEAGETRILSMVWDTTGVVPGSYQIGAYASQVPSETNLANNDYTDGMILVIEGPFVTYNVFFEQSGISNPAQVWSVTLEGYGTEYSNGPGNTVYTIAFTEVADGGTYQFIVTPPSGFISQPTSGTITVSGGDFHQPITFNAAPTTYTVLFDESGLPQDTLWEVTLNGQSQSSTSNSITFNVPGGSYSFSVTAPAGYTAVPSSGGLLINGPWTVLITFVTSLTVSVSPTTVTIDVGQSQLFAASVTGGTPPYTYKWYLDNVLVSDATSSTWTFTPTSALLHSVFVRVTDALEVFADSATVSVTVNKQMTLSISPTSVTRFVDQTLTFTMSLSGGSYPYTLQWYLNGNPVSGATDNYWNFVPAASGSYTIQLHVTDSAGAIAISNTATAQVLALESYTGVRNTITGVSSILAEFPWSFSLQQNFWIECLDWNIHGTNVLWCQNCIKIEKPTNTMMCDVEIWNTAANPPICLYHEENLQYGIPDNMFFDSEISGTSISFLNSAGLHIYRMADHFLVSGPVYIRRYNVCFVIVGLSSGANARFVNGNGYVTCQTMISDSLYNAYISGIVPHGMETGETSTGLAWDLTGHFTYLESSTDEGVYFEPYYYSPTVTNAGSVSVDQTSLTGVRVDVTGSSAPDEAPVTITTMKLTGAPTGVIEVGTVPAAYYDVNVEGISDGTARICITRSGITSQTTMQYYDGVQWKVASDVTLSGNTICGDVPVSALTGTIIAIGPLSLPPPSVTISPLSASILTGQSVTFTSAVSGGIAPYSFQWYLNGNPVSGATSNTWTFTPTSSGIYYIYLKVTDAAGNTKQSETARIAVATVPVGGYSIPIQTPATLKPLTPYLILTAILTIAYATIKRKTTKKTKTTKTS